MQFCPLPPPAHVTIVGDSISVGYSPESRYGSIAAEYLRSTERNLAVSATTSSYAIDVVRKMPKKPKRLKAFLVIAYGYNDQRNSTMTVWEYRQNLITIVNAARTKGYKPQEITIVSPWYVDRRILSQPGLTAYPWDGLSEWSIAAHRVTAWSAAIATGSRFYDGYAITEDAQYSDFVHPDPPLHRTIGSAIGEFLCR